MPRPRYSFVVGIVNMYTVYCFFARIDDWDVSAQDFFRYRLKNSWNNAYQSFNMFLDFILHFLFQKGDFSPV